MNELRDVDAFYRGVLGPEPHVPDGLLLHFLRGRATGAERERLELHLSACARCREDAEALRRFAATLVTPPPSPLVVSDEEAVPVATTRKRPPARRFPVLPALFLVVNAIGLGTIARFVAKPVQPAPPSPPSPSPTTEPTDLTRFRAAYEAQLAKERGKVTQLEMQVLALKATKPAAKPTLPVRSANESLKFPGDRGAISLSTHPTLLWKGVPNATKYVATLLSPQGKPVVKATALGTDWRVVTPLLRGTSYRWRVVALGKDGKALGKAQLGGVTVVTKDDAAQVARQLKQLADEFTRLGFKTEAIAARTRAAIIMAK